MSLKEFLAQPISSIKSWAAQHERFIAVNVTWTLAIIFIIVSIVYFLISLGVL
ncbi:MAG: hypothetical protein IJ584_01045 [Bacteroidales bacterium]|nr:hypothetical protein [Clostridia bacterium]MBR1433678.1 hypothetical protein [Bacteroidales bacterium]